MGAVVVIVSPTETLVRGYGATARGGHDAPDAHSLFQIGSITKILDDELKLAEKNDASYQDFLARVLRAQWHRTQETSLEWRIERARLPDQWTLESFPWKKQPGVSQKQIRGFADLDFHGPHVLVRRWLQRAQHRLAPRGEVRLVEALSSEECTELLVAQTSGLHDHAKLVFGLALLGSGRRALVQRGLLRHGADRTGGEQPSRKRGLRHPDLSRQRGRRDRVRSGHALDHLPLEVL